MKSLADPRMILSYFRDSLADADLFEFATEPLDLIPMNVEEVECGVLKDLSRFNFNNVDWIDVVICPILLGSKFSHQSSIQPKQHPVLIKAGINEKGEIQPSVHSPVWIPRRFLEPNGEDSLTLGHIDLADDYLAKNDPPTNWRDALGYAKAMLNYVCGMPHQEFFAQALLCVDPGGTVACLTKARQVNRKLIEVYDTLIKRNAAPGLLRYFTSRTNAPLRIGLKSLVQESAQRHLG